MMLLRLSLHGGVTIHNGYVCCCGLMANYPVPGILSYALFRHLFLLALLVTLVALLTPADSEPSRVSRRLFCLSQAAC